MGALKNVIEPCAIVLLFTAGALINRRRRPVDIDLEDGSDQDALLPQQRLEISWSRYMPDNSQFRNNFTSRFLDCFPFLIEIWYWNLTYWLYQLARAFSAYCIRGNKAVFDSALNHALQILSMEKRLHLDIELPLQKYILQKFPGLMPTLASIYYSHIVLGVLFIVYTYTTLPRPIFQRIRRSMAMNNLLAFIIITSWRCMPPRLLPKEYGYIDILHKGPQSAWTNNKFQLTIAAMPSLHFGTAAFLAFSLWKFSPHQPVRFIAPFWPMFMLLTILATANHFVIDAIVGVVVVSLGWRLNGLLLFLRPLEECLFLVLRTEKPRETRTENMTTYKNNDRIV